MPTGSATHGTIVVSSEPRGRFEGCIVSGARLPGIAMEVADVEPVTGQFTYGPAASGYGALGVLVEDHLQGRTIDDFYVSGEHGQLYFPLHGDFLLMRLTDANYDIGDLLTIGANGFLAASVGTGGVNLFQCFESITTGGGGSGGVLALCKYAGH